MTSCHFIIAIALIASTSVPARADDGVVTFATLSASDELKMTYATRGCFHDRTYDLTFRRAGVLTVLIEEVTFAWTDQKEYLRVGVRKLGDTALTEADVAGLDRLIRFYRTNQERGSRTFSHAIDLSQLRDGKTVAKEHFYDAACASCNKADLLSIQSLVSRLPPPVEDDKSK